MAGVIPTTHDDSPNRGVDIHTTGLTESTLHASYTS